MHCLHSTTPPLVSIRNHSNHISHLTSHISHLTSHISHLTSHSPYDLSWQGLEQLKSKYPSQQLNMPTAPIAKSAPMDIFQYLVQDLDNEGRYLFLNAIANQLRYPNNHTHYFSCVLLYLFSEASQEMVQEQVTRVLLERLIVNRPHPWGLLITFIELIKVGLLLSLFPFFVHCFV